MDLAGFHYRYCQWVYTAACAPSHMAAIGDYVRDTHDADDYLIIGVGGTEHIITITWSIWDDLISRESIVRSFYFAGIVSVIILTLGLAVSALLALRFTKPVVQLTKAATSVEKGDYNLDKLDNVSIRSDELGQLARVLQKMAKEVGGREQELKQQVQELRIEIDRAGQAEEVAKIVETDYFQQLRKKAKEFRKD